MKTTVFLYEQTVLSIQKNIYLNQENIFFNIAKLRFPYYLDQLHGVRLPRVTKKHSGDL